MEAGMNFPTDQAADDFFTLVEMFPHKCPQWIHANLTQGATPEALAELMLSGQAPDRPADRFNFEDVQVVDEEVQIRQLLAMGQVQATVVASAAPVLLERAAPPPPAIAHLPVPPAALPTRPVEHLAEPEVTCDVCSKMHTQSDCVRCHKQNEQPDDDSHTVCGPCMKKRWMVRRLKVLDDRSAVQCMIAKCPRIVNKVTLMQATKRFPMMAQWILGKRQHTMAETIRSTRRERVKQRKIRMEEPELTDEQRAELEGMLQYVKKESIMLLAEIFPNISPDWLLQNEGLGVPAVMSLVASSGEASIPRRMRPRRDGKGATTLIESFYELNSGMFECSVCFEEYPEYLAIDCVDRSSEEDMDGGDGHEKHSFCAECVRGHAITAQDQPVIVRAGLGITCMEGGCVGTLLMAHIEQVLNEETRRFLEPLVADQAVRAAAIDLERCKKCNFGATVERDADAHPVFACQECGAEHCRKCDREWNERHVNRTCEELDPELQRKRMEEQLNDAVAHKCIRCGKQYIRQDGCNLITCPCGAQMCYVCNADLTGTGHRHFVGGCPQHSNPDAELAARRQQLLQQEVDRADPDVARELNLLR